MRSPQTPRLRATLAVSAVLALSAVVAISASPGSVHAANIVPHDLGACTELGSQPAKDSKGNYYAGAAVSLNASGLAAGPVRLFYNGPRGAANGETEQSPHQYTLLGTDTVASNGALHVHVTIPDDAAPGTGHVLAYSTTQSLSGTGGLLSRAIHDWAVPVTYHNPWVTLSGEAGQTLDLRNVANGDTCHALVGADGQTPGIVASAPGIWDVAVNGHPEVPLVSVPLVYGGNQTMPALPHFSFLNGCTNVRFRAFDLFSGTPTWVNNLGGPPFGYFLSRSNTPDPIAIVATAYDANGATEDLSDSCVATINGLTLRQITPNPGGGTTTKLMPNSGALVPPHATVQSFAALYTSRLCALLPCPGGNSVSAFYAAAVPSQIYSRVFMTQIGLTSLPAGTEGTGTLTMTDGFNTAQTFGTMQLIANRWEASSLFSGASPVFHTNTRSYSMVETAANVPALGGNNNYTGPNVNFGWNSAPYISNSSWSFNTQVKSYYSLQEGFSTDGVWGSTGSVFNTMTLLGQNIYGPTVSGVAVTAHNPYRPSYAFSLPNAATWTKNGLVDTSVPVGGISIGNWNIGVNLQVKVDASAALGVSGSVAQHLDAYSVTFTPSGTLHGWAALTLNSGPFGVGLAVNGYLTLAVPISDSAPGGWSAAYCLSGELDWGIYYSWNFGWLGSGSGYWYGPKPLVGPGTIAGTCPVAFSHMKVFHHRVSAAAKARLRSEGYRVIEIPPSPPPTPPSASEDFDSAHHGAAVWVEAQGDHGALMAAPWAGTHWGTPVTVATNGQALGSPQVVELGDGRAVAAWRELMPFSLAEEDLLSTYKQNHDYASAAALMASHAEVFSAVFNGSSWSAPHRLTNDLVGDSSLALVADKSVHTATIVWGRTDPTADYGLVKARFSGKPGSWSSMTAIAHTVGTGTRDPSLAIGKGTVTLGFISGPPGHGAVKVGTLSGSTFTPAASQPPIPEGAENLRVVQLPTGTLATADVQPLSAGAFTGNEPTLYVATNLGTGWKLTNVGAGDSPQVAFDGSNTLITFRRPDGGALSANTPNQLADVEVSSKGAVSKVGSVTGANAQAMPAAAAFDPTGHLQLLFQSDPLPDGPSNPSWSWAINAAAKPLSSLEATSVPLHAPVVADLAAAKVSPAACTPGKSVTATVTLHNPAPTQTTAAGRISEVAAGGTSAARRRNASGGVRFSATIKGNATATVKVSFSCPSSGYTLHATGVASTSSPTLGVPGAPSNLVVGSSSAGDARLTWNLPAKSTAVRTLVYESGSAGWVLEGITEDTSFVDLGAGTDSTRQYVVVAVDEYGRQSRRSKIATSS